MLLNLAGNGMAERTAHSELAFSDQAKRLATPGGDVWMIHSEGVRRAQNGEDVIILSVGDPDFDTPGYIAEHVVAQMRAGRTHYSPAAGENRLREAIADLETRSTGRDFSREQVVVFPGATAALYAVFSCVLNAGDGVLIPEPMYIGYQGIFDAIGADIQQVPLQPLTFELDVDLLLQAIQPNTRAVLINTPGNPCGNLIKPETLRRLARECRERDLWLVCDEVYSLITFDAPHVSMLKCTEDLANVVVIDGLSKSHAMTGWRVGWTIADMPMTRALINMSGAAFFGVCQFVQDGAAFALANNADEVEMMRRSYQRRRDYVIERVRNMSQLDCFVPPAGMFVMLNGSRVANSGDTFARMLLDQAGISTIPGSGFGPGAKDYVRLSLTVPVGDLARAFDRMEALFR